MHLSKKKYRNKEKGMPSKTIKVYIEDFQDIRAHIYIYIYICTFICIDIYVFICMFSQHTSRISRTSVLARRKK